MPEECNNLQPSETVREAYEKYRKYEEDLAALEIQMEAIKADRVAAARRIIDERGSSAFEIHGQKFMAISAKGTAFIRRKE